MRTFLDEDHFTVTLYGGRGKGALLGLFFNKPPIQFMRAVPKAPPPDTIILRVKISVYEFGRGRVYTFRA